MTWSQAGVKADEGTLLVVGDLNFRCELLTDPVSKAKGGKDWEAVRCQALPLIRAIRCCSRSCLHRSVYRVVGRASMGYRWLASVSSAALQPRRSVLRRLCRATVRPALPQCIHGMVGLARRLLPYTR